MKNKKVEYLLKSKEGEVLRLELGGGKQEGFISFGDFGGADIRHGVEDYPYPIPDNSITIIKVLHVAEQINPLNGGFLKWMDELWRIMKYDGQLLLSIFYAGSVGYWADPMNVNGCTDETWDFFDPLRPSSLYKKYKPKPWKKVTSFANPDGLMEVLLVKRREDPSYKKNERY